MNRTYPSNPWIARPPGPSPAGMLFRLILMPFVILAAAALVAAGLFPAVGGAGKAVKVFNDQFQPSESDLTVPQLALRSTIFANDGSVISQVADENRIPVKLDEVSQAARDAILAGEDHSFYHHGAID